MIITRRFKFSAAHLYRDPDLTPEENRARFGACYSEYGHGHNYVLDVSVRGAVDPRTGMIVNLKDLKQVVQERVIARYDHKHLNFEVEDFRETLPTTEALVLRIWDLLDGRIPGCDLAKIRLYEHDELFAEYAGQPA
ncbi:MAG: 6-carboxytetrahydropterin synthase [bacterium]|nr:6-carboxytetrahydropterin synthase [bacterium]